MIEHHPERRHRLDRERRELATDPEFELFGNSYIMAGETRTLDSQQRRRLKRMVRTYGKHAKDKGIVLVADAWNQWHGFSEDAQKN